MQYVVIAHDGTDAKAADRRTAARPAHIEGAKRMKEAGTLLTGGAILDDDGNMIGSVMVVDFSTREDLDTWLDGDPYVTGNAWERIEVKPFRVAI